MHSPDPAALLGAAVKLREQCDEAVEAVSNGDDYSLLLNRMSSVLVVMASTAAVIEGQARTTMLATPHRANRWRTAALVLGGVVLGGLLTTCLQML